MRLRVGHQHSQFWPILARFVDCLLMVSLRVGHQQSQFWPILARLVDYYSLFWAPGVITTINKPWDAFTCRSPTLAVLGDSGPFHGLLLTVLGSRSDYHD